MGWLQQSYGHRVVETQHPIKLAPTMQKIKEKDQAKGEEAGQLFHPPDAPPHGLGEGLGIPLSSLGCQKYGGRGTAFGQAGSHTDGRDTAYPTRLAPTRKGKEEKTRQMHGKEPTQRRASEVPACSLAESEAEEVNLTSPLQLHREG